VDLIAGLDALEAAGTQAQVVLLDTVTAMRLAPPVEVPEDGFGTRRRGLASTVGRSPVVTADAEAGGAAAGAVPPVVDEDGHVDDDDEHPAADDVADDEASADQDGEADDEVADDGLADQRDVEVLDAAAEATALAMADAEADPLPERLEDLPDAPASDGGATATDAEAPAEDPAAAEDPAEDPVAPDDQTADLDPGGHDDRYGTFDADARGEESPFADPVVDLAHEEEPAPTGQPEPRQSGGERDDSLESDIDGTDRIPPVGSDVTGVEADPAGADDRFPPGDANDSDEDLLRTTAQLAILADDLALRSGFQPEPEPHRDTPAHLDRPHHLDDDDARESGGPDEDHT